MAAAGLVAVATATEYSGPGTSGGNLSVVNCGPNSGTGPGPGPGSWSRSLDRALEEAAVTGVLSLSGRKLREFPRGAANHDLTDTTRAAYGGEIASGYSNWSRSFESGLGQRGEAGGPHPPSPGACGPDPELGARRTVTPPSPAGEEHRRGLPGSLTLLEN
uniref:Leucine rich repeats and calponin homology domain containing 3 n=1 Tax=Sus scrofa TaxID=9823 RepID=A0A8W4FH52_PIG